MKPYWQIKNQDKPEILIYGPIESVPFFDDEIGAKQFREELQALGDVKAFDLRINSPGGDVFEADAIYTTLIHHPAQIDVFIDGVAASAAAYVAMSGDSITMPRNSQMMIHPAHGGIYGTADIMERRAQALRNADSNIIGIFSRRTKIEEGKLRDMMNPEFWMDGKTAVELGFADILDEPVRMAACFDWDRYAYQRVPEQLTAKTGETPRLDQFKDKFQYARRLQQRARLVQEWQTITRRNPPTP